MCRHHNPAFSKRATLKLENLASAEIPSQLTASTPTLLLMRNFLWLLLLAPLNSSCLPDHSDHSVCAPEGGMPTGLNATVELDPDFPPEELAYTLLSGTAITEGDIALARASELEASGIITTGRLWDPNDIPYRISPDLPDPKRVAEAVENWRSASGGKLRFRALKDSDPLPKDYIEFVRLEGCWSYVGKRGGRQEISLDDGCTGRASTHELGHALGLWHEQSRADRDEHVSIKWCNIEDGKADNFRKHATTARDHGPYDYDSIMHYPSGAFSKNWKNTIQSITDTPVCPWAKRRISPGDWAAVKDLYQL